MTEPDGTRPASARDHEAEAALAAAARAEDVPAT